MASTEATIHPPHVFKRRRTKRRRNSPAAAAQPSWSSGEEEEDMANCLILLAQGPPPTAKIQTEKISSTGVATDEKDGFFLYECNTCSKCFPTFQALGGHRTSHKKPKLPIKLVQGRKTGEIEKDLIQLSINSSSHAIKDKIARVHECLICGSKFSSGQALGGHMRRHRQTRVSEIVETKKEKSNIVMSLDLNLPATDEDYCCSGGCESPACPSAAAAAAATFSFASKSPQLLLSTSALFKCLY